MSVVTIKPSRGTVIFFAALIVGSVIKIAWGKRAHQSFLEDAPPVHTARRLLRCVLGRDAQRVLGARPTDPLSTEWSDRVTARLRLIVASEYSPEWPARCVPIADRLAARLDHEPHGATAVRFADETRRLLGNATTRRLAAIEAVESGALGVQLAGLAYHVSALSVGAEQSWMSPLPAAPSDLDPVRTDTVPVPVPLPADATYPALLLPDLALYQSVLDRRAHQLAFDRTGRFADRALGRGAPVVDMPREGAALVSGDDSDALLLPGGEPAQRVALPQPVADGTELLGRWSVALTQTDLWLLTDDEGVLRVRRTARAAPVLWSDPVFTVGERDGMVGGVLAPSGEHSGSVRLIAARRTATGVRVEAYPVEATMPSTPSRPTELVPEWQTFDPSVTTCSAGAVRYLMIRGDDGISVVTVRPEAAYRTFIAFADVGAPSGGRMVFSCSEHAALLLADLQGPRTVLVAWDGETNRAPIMVNVPLLGAGAGLVGAALHASGLVAIVDNGVTARAYTMDSLAASTDANPIATWGGGALLAVRVVTLDAGRPIDRRSLEVMSVVGDGDQVALLAQVTEGEHSFVARLASHDGGATWRADR